MCAKCSIPNCEYCNVELKPIYTEVEDEFGEKHIICDYLICPLCLRRMIVDDTFDLS